MCSISYRRRLPSNVHYRVCVSLCVLYLTGVVSLPDGLEGQRRRLVLCLFVNAHGDFLVDFVAEEEVEGFVV